MNDEKPTPQYIDRVEEFGATGPEDRRVGIPTPDGRILILSSEDSLAIEEEFRGIEHTETLTLADWADILYALEDVHVQLPDEPASRMHELIEKISAATTNLATPIIGRYVEKYADTSAAAEVMEEFLDHEL